MTRTDPANVDSRRRDRLTEKFQDRSYRAAYLVQHTRGFLASQIRALRGEMSQSQFGAQIGRPQSVVSRLEDEEYGRVSLQTLLDIAAKLDVGLVVRFVDFATFLDLTDDFSEEAFAPSSFGTAPLQEEPDLLSAFNDYVSTPVQLGAARFFDPERDEGLAQAWMRPRSAQIGGYPNVPDELMGR